jgi:dTMP kinase
MNHKYIAFEGLDGAGKDTQKNLAVQYIQDKDKYAFIRQMREPSKFTESGRKLAELLKGNTLDPQTALSYFIKDRVELSAIIRQNLEHSHVISSRCFLSSYLYQQTQGLSFDTIHEQHLTEDIQYPDHIIFFDLPVETLEKRLAGRGGEREIFETLEFQKRNREIAHETLPRITQSPISIIDASGTKEEVFEQVKPIIDDIFF